MYVPMSTLQKNLYANVPNGVLQYTNCVLHAKLCPMHRTTVGDAYQTVSYTHNHGGRHTHTSVCLTRLCAWLTRIGV